MRYIIGFIIGLGLIVLLFILIFRGPSTPPSAQHKLVDYANTSTVMQFVDDYTVNADQTHRRLITTVGRDQTTFTVEQGYQGTVMRTQSYGNNEASYAYFLQALQVAGYTNGDTNAKNTDYRGYCPTGRRFIFSIKDGANTIQQFWATSCGGAATFHGKTTTILDLFKLQVPDYDKLTSDVGLQ